MNKRSVIIIIMCILVLLGIGGIIYFHSTKSSFTEYEETPIVVTNNVFDLDIIWDWCHVDIERFGITEEQFKNSTWIESTDYETGEGLNIYSTIIESDGVLYSFVYDVNSNVLKIL